jgi:hypothetical protein
MSSERLCNGEIGRMFRRTVIAAIIMQLSHSAYAESGSTGGSIGKRDKGVSGTVEAPPPRLKPGGPAKTTSSKPSPDAASQPCGKIVGAWDWGSGGTVTFKSNGTVDMTNGDSATWTCREGVYTIQYKLFGNTTRGTVSADGNQFSGKGALGSFVSDRLK